MDNEVLPLVQLMHKEEGDITMKDLLNAMVLMHNSYTSRLAVLENNLLTHTETRIKTVEESIVQLQTNVSEAHNDLDTRINALSTKMENMTKNNEADLNRNLNFVIHSI